MGAEMVTNIEAELSINSGNLILVNQEYPYVEEREAEFSAVGSGKSVLMRKQAAERLNSLMDRISGWNSIEAVSGWRSLAEQQEIWDNSMKENGIEFTRKYVAVPGHSEHQTGLAIDLGLKSPNIDFIRPDFPYGGICQNFRELAAGFGFTERYPKGKEAVTGIGHEPWHFRYVGVPHAEIMQKNGFVLEEYIEFLKKFYNEKHFVYETEKFVFEIYFVPVGRESEISSVDLRNFEYSISGNNADGFIVTMWRSR